jgi:hypothetical protein
LWIVVAAFVITAGWGTVRAVRAMQLKSAEQAWPSAEASITGSTVRESHSKSGVRWSPVWTYVYTVEGRSYTSNSIAVANGYDANWYDDRASAERDAASRSIGSQVNAYYDPAAPERSVLDRRTSTEGDWMSLGVSILLAIVAAWICWMLMTAPAFTGRERPRKIRTFG